MSIPNYDILHRVVKRLVLFTVFLTKTEVALKNKLRQKINEIEGTWLYVNDELIGSAPVKDIVSTIDFIEGLKDELVDMFFEATNDINRIEDAKSFKPLMPSFYEFIKKYSGWDQEYFDSMIDEMETDNDFYESYAIEQVLKF